MNLALRADHRTQALWACDCAQRVLPFFEEVYRADRRPRQAIDTGRAWVRTGIFNMRAIRAAALGAHAAARTAPAFSPARSSARAAGQAVAAAHSGRHAIAAAIYAATAVRDAASASDADSAVFQEREWQYRRLRQLLGRRARKPSKTGIRCDK